MNSSPLDLVSGAPFWLLQNGLADPPLTPPSDCDVVVVGAGVTGAMLADALTAVGFTVCIIDRRVPAVSSTAACTGLLTYELDVELGPLIDHIGETRAVRSYRACVRGLARCAALAASLPDPCGFERRASLYLASRRRDGRRLRREAELRTQHDLDVTFQSREQVADETGFPSYGALRTDTSALVDPVRLTRALLARAQAAGAVMCARTTLTSWSSDARSVRVETTRGSCAASWIVFATGYETPPELAADLVTLHSTYALVTTPCEKDSFGGRWSDRCMMWETARPYHYLRPADGGRVIIGGEDIPFKTAALRDRLMPGKIAHLERRLRELFPSLKAETEFAWTGTFGETQDGLPYIGARNGLPRALFALGYGGNGIVFSEIASHILRNVILGEGDEELDLFALERE